MPAIWFLLIFDLKYFSRMRIEFSLVLRHSNIVNQTIIAPKNSQ